MFVLGWIGSLLAAPVMWLGELVGWVASAPAGRCFALAWWLSGDGEVANRALAAVAKAYGEQAAVAQAVQWMQSRPDPAIAAYGGLVALQNGQTDLAWQLLRTGKPLGTDRDGHLELLEWLLTSGTGDRVAMHRMAQEWEGRRDLTPLLSRQVLTTLLWEALHLQRFDEARRRAEHLLSIEAAPEAEMALWAMAKRDGDVRQAEFHLRQARMEPRHKLSCQIAGNIAIGFLDEARVLQAQLAEQTLSVRQEESAG